MNRKRCGRGGGGQEGKRQDIAFGAGVQAEGVDRFGHGNLLYDANGRWMKMAEDKRACAFAAACRPSRHILRGRGRTLYSLQVGFMVRAYSPWTGANLKTNRRVPASGGLSANAGATPFPRRGRGAECSLRTRGGYTLRERNPMCRVCTGLLLSISIMKPIHAMCRVYAGAAVTCATVQPVVSSLTFTDKRGMLLRAFSVAFAGSGRPQGVFA